MASTYDLEEDGVGRFKELSLNSTRLRQTLQFSVRNIYRLSA